MLARVMVKRYGRDWENFNDDRYNMDNIDEVIDLSITLKCCRDFDYDDIKVVYE